ncbi:hypothetical protein ABPG77_001166 [Micractinium sp. CCAP 211/92]
MVIQNDAAKVLDLMALRHRERDDPDEDFLDRLEKKTSFYDQPAAPPEEFLPPAAHAAKAALDELADINLDDGDFSDEESLKLQTGAPPALVSKAALTAEAAAAAAERERREARYAALFYGRSSGGRQQGDVPEELPFNRISSQPSSEVLPEVGHPPVSQEEAEEAAEAAEDEAARRAAWRELNRLREQHGQADAAFRAAHERFVATWGHRGAELRE